MQIVFDFIAGDIPFDEFWDAYCADLKIGKPQSRYRKRHGSSRPLPAPCAENDLPRVLPTFKTVKSSAPPVIVRIQGGCDGIPV